MRQDAADRASGSDLTCQQLGRNPRSQTAPSPVHFFTPVFVREVPVIAVTVVQQPLGSVIQFDRAEGSSSPPNQLNMGMTTGFVSAVMFCICAFTDNT